MPGPEARRLTRSTPTYGRERDRRERREAGVKLAVRGIGEGGVRLEGGSARSDRGDGLVGILLVDVGLVERENERFRCRREITRRSNKIGGFEGGRRKNLRSRFGRENADSLERGKTRQANQEWT